ncbi:MAG: glycosyltransferase family 4 protein, partial [Proteobacteria bacterium]|nr:glycosyltransferase family 4 protein [Pseudomonadota bacterium]
MVLSIFFKHKQGGFNKRLYELYLGLASRGVSVHYVAAERFPLKHENLVPHVLRTPCSRQENYVFWAYFLTTAPFLILYLAWKHRADRLVVFEPFYACLCLPAKWLLGKPLITFIRSDVAREYEILGKSWLQRYFNTLVELIGLKFSNKIIPNSHLLANKLKGRNRLDSALISVVPNNIQDQAAPSAAEREALRAQYGIRKEEFVVTTAAVFNETKNLSFLINCFSQA